MLHDGCATVQVETCASTTICLIASAEGFCLLLMAYIGRVLPYTGRFWCCVESFSPVLKLSNLIEGMSPALEGSALC
jgi:hypothetical protein